LEGPVSIYTRWWRRPGCSLGERIITEWYLLNTLQGTEAKNQDKAKEKVKWSEPGPLRMGSLSDFRRSFFSTISHGELQE
jgi:hypothetical protein